MNRKKGIIIFSLLLVVLFLTFVILRNIKANENYVIRINGNVIMQDEIDLYFALMKNEMEESAEIETDEERQKFWEQKIDGVSTLDIVSQKAEEYLITNKVAAEQAKKMKLKILDEELLEKQEELTYLLQERNITNISESLMNKFAEDIILGNKLYNEIAKEIAFTDEDIFNLYNIYNVKQIVLESDNENVASIILNRIKSGEDFDKFITYSIDATKNVGGKFSFYDGEFYNNVYEQAVKNLKIGEISNLVHTENGIYIIKLESIEKPKGDILAEIKLKYSDDILNQKRSDAYDEKIKELTENAVIEYKES